MNMQAVTGSLAHELKQPLTAICVNGEAAQLFLNRADPNLEQAQSALDSVIADGHRAARTIDDLRALFAKTDKQQEPIDVNEVSLQALKLLQTELNAHSIATEIALGELPSIMGHKGQLQEVMINLLQNAIEAMNATNDRRSLRLSTERRGNSIFVEVKDSGPGIDRTKLNRVFDAFFTTKTQGTGLGLAICRMIVNRHGGKISASSDGEHGTLFQVILPTSLHQNNTAE
jgi:signal transduction histidine kinase